jgi:hypothetical protein
MKFPINRTKSDCVRCCCRIGNVRHDASPDETQAKPEKSLRLGNRGSVWMALENHVSSERAALESAEAVSRENLPSVVVSNPPIKIPSVMLFAMLFRTKNRTNRCHSQGLFLPRWRLPRSSLVRSIARQPRPASVKKTNLAELVSGEIQMELLPPGWWRDRH